MSKSWITSQYAHATRGTYVTEVYTIRYVHKTDCWWMRGVGRVMKLLTGHDRFMTNTWTTVRLPLGLSTIYYPQTVADPLVPEHDGVRLHEYVHVRQQWTTLGLLWSFALYFFLPLPVFLSGRWLVEREAFLVDLRAHRCTVDQVVSILWSLYWRPWPRSWMKRWFQAELVVKDQRF